MRDRPLLIIAAALITASPAMGRDTLHLRTSRDSFIHEQFTTKAEFIEALREHPDILRDMAKCVHQTPQYLLDYIGSSVHLGRLQEGGRYFVWGRTKGDHRLVKSWRHFKAGMPVWVAEDGTPLFRWLCGNPMADSLVAEAMPATPAPVAEVTPPPPAPTEQPAPPPPPPAVVEQPVPAPTPPPPPPPAPQPTALPKPSEEPPAPPSDMLEFRVNENHPTRIQVGDLQWTAHRDKSDGIVTAGISEDLFGSRWGGHFGIYGDSAGMLQNDPPFRFYGGGVQYRQNLTHGHALRLYGGVGVGVYHVVVHDWSDESRDRWGEKAFLGVDTSSDFFLELALTTFGKTDQRQLTTLGLSIGYRF
jgi:hypothetical protein